MRVYKGIFTKKNGQKREMTFARIPDIDGINSGYVAAKISGSGREINYPEGMELVIDLELDDFRVFNWKTAEEVNSSDIPDSRAIEIFNE